MPATDVFAGESEEAVRAMKAGRVLSFERVCRANLPGGPLPAFVRMLQNHAACYYLPEDEAKVVNWLGDEPCPKK